IRISRLRVSLLSVRIWVWLLPVQILSALSVLRLLQWPSLLLRSPLLSAPSPPSINSNIDASELARTRGSGQLFREARKRTVPAFPNSQCGYSANSLQPCPSEPCEIWKKIATRVDEHHCE